MMDHPLAYSHISGGFYSGGQLNEYAYVYFGQPDERLLVFALAVAALYLACCFVRIAPKKAAPDKTP